MFDEIESDKCMRNDMMTYGPWRGWLEGIFEILHIPPPCCDFRGSPMERDRIMNDLWVKKDGDAGVIKEIEKICKDIDEKIGNKKNKRRLFFEMLMDRKEDDGFLIITHIEHFKKNLEGGENTTLNMVFKEWKTQRVDAAIHDTLYDVLLRRNDPVEYRCIALARLAKRIRGGQNAYNNNAFVARKIIQMALDMYELHEERGDIGNASDFSSTPVEHFRLTLEYQEVFNLVRFGKMRRVVQKAKDLEEEVNKISDLRKSDWRPDIRLKWWTWQCRLRAAAFCLDSVLWVQARDQMRELEDEAEKCGAHGLADYLRNQKEKEPPIREGTDPMRPGTRKLYLKRIERFLSSWHELSKVDGDAVNYRQLRRRGEKVDSARDKVKKIQTFSSSFTHDLEGFLKILHTNTNIPRPVKHTHNTTTAEKLERSKNILAEISHARHSTVLLGSERTFFVLEILHRLMIYRLWWESLNYIGREPKLGDRFDASRSCFDIAHAEGILRDIREGLRKCHHLRVDGCIEIDRSIKIISDLEKRKMERGEITDYLRRHLNYLHSEGRRRWDGEELGGLHENFFGLWYMRDEPGRNSYKTPDPLMKAIGMWPRPKEEKEETFSDEIDESDPLWVDLRHWRDEQAEAEMKKAFQIAWNSTLSDLVLKRPKNHSDLLKCKGIGERKLDLYGEEILRIIQENSTGSG